MATINGFIVLNTILGNKLYIQSSEISEIMKQSKGPGTLIVTRSGHEYRIIESPEAVMMLIDSEKRN